MVEHSGSLMANARVGRGWTATEVAEAAGISLVALERFEAGRSDLLPTEIGRLERVLARTDLPKEPVRRARGRPAYSGRRW
jgi:transcriptional regulator with XRE-family HTH domain